MFKRVKKKDESMTPGLTKLNVKFTQTPKQTAAEGMRKQPEATGNFTRSSIGSRVAGQLSQDTTLAHFGIKAQRSDRLITNVKAGNSRWMSLFRHQMVDGQAYYGDNVYVGSGRQKTDVNNDYMNSYMKMMELQALTQGISSIGAGAAQMVSLFKSDKPESTVEPEGSTDPVDNNTLYAQLQSAQSFKDINAAKGKLNTSLSSFSNNYSSSTDTEMSAIDTAITEDVKAGLEEARINNINGILVQLKPNSINLTTDSDASAFSTAFDTIDNDINEVTYFLDTTLGTLSQSLATTEQNLQSRINAARSKDPNTNVSGLEAKLHKVQAAKTVINGAIKTNASKIKDNLIKKKQELEDLKKTKDAIADKEYNLAKEQDEKLAKMHKKCTDLASEIDKLKQKTPPDKDKINKKINEYNGYASSFNQLKASLKAIKNNQVTFVNSNNQSYSLVNIQVVGNRDFEIMEPFTGT